MRVVSVIPARFGATRLPGKPLSEINGKPMIQWVYERAARARGIAETVVATDDDRIRKVVESFGGRVIMTSPDLQSGTDRVAAVARDISADIYVNVQGDEPFIQPEIVEKGVELVSSGRFSMGTVMSRIENRDQLQNPAAVKVICDQSGRAIYFSRFAIPYSRLEAPADLGAWVPFLHIGLYVYTRETLKKFSELPPTPLEKAESLEQLRALYFGIPIGVAEVKYRGFGIDTPEDLENARKLLRNVEP